MTPKFWQYSSDVTYLKEKSKELGKSLKRFNKIKKAWTDKKPKSWEKV